MSTLETLADHLLDNGELSPEASLEEKRVYYLIALHSISSLNDKLIAYIKDHPKYIDIKLSEISSLIIKHMGEYSSKAAEVISQSMDEELKAIEEELVQREEI